MAQPVIFTDLDGTLLDSAYSFEGALPALKRVREEKVPLVPTTSKTRAEVESLLARLSMKGPFITENGGGVFIPAGSFPFPVGGDASDGLSVIRLGAGYDEIRTAFVEIREKTGFKMTGFADMTPEEITERTGLSPEEALLSKERDFDEPFFLDSGSVDTIAALAEEKGLAVTLGRLLHMTGKSDKGKAAGVLAEMYKKVYGSIVTIGLGDAPNDIPLLKAVDYPVLVMNRSGGYEAVEGVPGLILADGIGPDGWTRAVNGILDSIRHTGGGAVR